MYQHYPLPVLILVSTIMLTKDEPKYLELQFSNSTPTTLPPVLPLVKFLQGPDFYCGIHTTYLLFSKETLIN